MGPLDILAAAAASAPLRLRRAFAPPRARGKRRLLILGYGAIGDTIFFLPALEAVRRAFPDAKLTWVSNPAPVARELIPSTGLVDDVWLFDFEGQEGLRRRGEISARIRDADFDAAILTPSSPAHYFQAALADIPIVAAHRFAGLTLKRRLILGDPSRAALGARSPARLGTEHAAQRSMRLLESLGLRSDTAPRPRLPIGPSERRRAEELLGAEACPLVGVHLGPPTSYNFRLWKPEHFGELAVRLSAAWPRAKFVLIGGAEESSCAARARAAGLRDAVDQIGRASLLETFALIERCALFISCDTGLSKAAMALGVPTAVLWGPSSPLESGVIWDRERHLELATGIECSPCSFSGMPRDRRKTYLNCGSHACLAEMTADWASRRILARWPQLLKS